MKHNTNKDIALEVEKRGNISLPDALVLISHVVDVLGEALARDESVLIKNFAKFEVRTSTWQPLNLQQMPEGLDKKPRRAIKITMSRNFGEVLNDDGNNNTES